MVNKSGIITSPYKKEKKDRFKRFLFWILVVTLFLTSFLYVSLYFLIKNQAKNIKELRLENEYFSKEIKKFQVSDKAYEEVLRTKYGYIGDGEKIIIYSKKHFLKNQKRR